MLIWNDYMDRKLITAIDELKFLKRQCSSEYIVVWELKGTPFRLILDGRLEWININGKRSPFDKYAIEKWSHTFSEMFDKLSPEVQEKFLFHLDIFR